MVKFIVVTGGVISSLGKGITSASLALLLNQRGLRTTVVKMDPYINPDAGLMSPFEHGEVFVTFDGGETDLDLGNYERFLDHELSKENNITTGKVYLDVIQRERRGEYLGKTVQVIPHITDDIKRRVHAAGRDFQVVVIEVGGVVGDIENIPFVEALRQIYLENKHSMVFLHLALIPFLDHIRENKTKPAQHSVRELLAKGIQPDILLCRCRKPLTFAERKKLSLFCNVSMEDVFVSFDTKNKYSVPDALRKQKLETRVISKLGILNYEELAFGRWERMLHKMAKMGERPVIRVALIKKYTAVDNYISLEEALKHAALHLNVRLELVHVNAEDENIEDQVKKVHAVLVPGGWGLRGTHGKMRAITFARQTGLPFLGICYGFQLAAIEYAQNVLKLKGASSTEFAPDTKHAVVLDLNTLVDSQESSPIDLKVSSKLRLGSRKVALQSDSLARKVYGFADSTIERFRHRYTLNPDYVEQFEKGGLRFSGVGPEDHAKIVDILELPEHAYFLAVQFHPEFRTKVFVPHPIFLSFLEAAAKAAEISLKKELALAPKKPKQKLNK